MSALVFISHSSADRDVAGKLCEALERRGFGCWLAARDIGPGENFQEAIVKAIRSVRAMVLVFTGNANNSSEIKKELALASQSHLVVIPLRVEDVVPGDAFLYEFSTRQWIDAFDDWDRAIGRLAEQIRGVVGAEGSAPPPLGGAGHGRPATARPRRAKTLALATAVGTLVIAGGLAALYWTGGNLSVLTATAQQDISGKWITGSLTNPYDRNQTSVLHFDFQQSGETLSGTVRETSRYGGALKGIHDGRIKDGAVSFYTQGMTTSGTGTQPYKEHYRGTLKKDGIAFVRQNDVPSGGLPQNFTAKRE